MITKTSSKLHSPMYQDTGSQPNNCRMRKDKPVRIVDSCIGHCTGLRQRTVKEKNRNIISFF